MTVEPRARSDDLVAAVAFQCARAEMIRSESSAVVERARSAYRHAVETGCQLTRLRADSANRLV